jgi:tRNA (cytidine/uridine-2'-O-)-methyltransferase
VLHLALWEPEIPPNTGNAARLCAATATRLHLVGRCSFRLDDRSLRRAGVDYWDAVDLQVHDSFAAFEQAIGPDRIVCIETGAAQPYTRAGFRDGDCILFGNESRGLPETVRQRYADRTFFIPMPSGKVRSINLASAAAVVLYEALRHLHGW